MDVSQQQRLSQQMKMSPQMLQSLSFLTMSGLELSEYIHAETERNPALEIVRDASVDSGVVAHSKKTTRENVRLGNASSVGSAESDDFQRFLESRPQPTESLQEHLWKQYRLVASTDAELSLGMRLISNLDERGFNRMPPEYLLDEGNEEYSPELLRKCLALVQQLEPEGCATSGSEESLLVQARLAGDVPPLALYILNGRLSVLEKSRPAVVVRRIQEELAQSHGTKENTLAPTAVTEGAVAEAVAFIRGLEPFPARQFDSGQTHYIMPDIRVRKVLVHSEEPGENDGIQFQVELVRGVVPEIAVSPVYRELAQTPARRGRIKSGSEQERRQQKFARDAVREAEWFINSIQQREDTLLKASLAIVHAQRRFFEKGPLYLAPLKMKDVAEKIGVHETTVSRLANGKYIQCDWGVFEIRHFFSNQVAACSRPAQATQKSALEKIDAPLVEPGVARSKESVKLELKAIIQEYASKHPGAKPLSDQKLSDMLAERGVKIARRTVAKYRYELNIESSFDR